MVVSSACLTYLQLSQPRQFQLEGLRPVTRRGHLLLLQRRPRYFETDRSGRGRDIWN